MQALSRRAYLAGLAGAAGAGGLAGTPAARDASAQAPGDRQDFVWLNGALTRDEDIFRNVLAFMERHDLAGVISAADTSQATAQKIRPVLERTGEWGVPTWLASGCFRGEHTAPELVGDDAAMQAFLDRLRTVAETYAEYEPEGKFVCWHEAPWVSRWAAEGGANTITNASVRSMVENGPAVFAAQKRTIQAVSADIDVGLFVHYPYIAESGEYATLNDALRERGALPDFSFTDFYRGYREPSDGVTSANLVVRKLLDNAREATDGRPVYYLGEDHTINNNYTPSKQALRENHRVSRDADGLGWYSRGRYRRTHRGFNPFVPNVGPLEDDRFTTLVGSRDRFQYAYRLSNASRRGFDPTNRFDLWLHLDDASFYDHRLSLRGPDGWEYVADVPGYLDGDHPYAPDGRDHVAIVHGLRRDRFVRDGRLEWRLRTAEGAGATLQAVYAMPHDTGNYVAEREATRLAEEGDLVPYAAGARVADGAIDLRAGERVSGTVPVTGADRGLGELLYPDWLEPRERLASAESCAGFDPGSLVDIWLAGSGFDDVTVADTLYVTEGEEYAPVADRSVAVESTDEMAVFYGVDRALADGYVQGSMSLAVAAPEGGPPRVDLIAAMPYFGRDNFKSPGRAAELVAEDTLSARSFAVADIGFYDRVDPATVPGSSGRKQLCADRTTTTAATASTTATPTATARTDPATTTRATTPATTSPGTPGPGMAGAVGALLGGAVLSRLWTNE